MAGVKSNTPHSTNPKGWKEKTGLGDAECVTGSEGKPHLETNSLSMATALLREQTRGVD